MARIVLIPGRCYYVKNDEIELLFKFKQKLGQEKINTYACCEKGVFTKGSFWSDDTVIFVSDQEFEELREATAEEVYRLLECVAKGKLQEEVDKMKGEIGLPLEPIEVRIQKAGINLCSNGLPDNGLDSYLLKNDEDPNEFLKLL